MHSTLIIHTWLPWPLPSLLTSSPLLIISYNIPPIIQSELRMYNEAILIRKQKIFSCLENYKSIKWVNVPNQRQTIINFEQDEGSRYKLKEQNSHTNKIKKNIWFDSKSIKNRFEVDKCNILLGHISRKQVRDRTGMWI